MVFRFAGFARAAQGFDATGGGDTRWGVAHFVWVFSDDAPDDGDARQRPLLLCAPASQQHMEFGLAEVGV